MTKKDTGLLVSFVFLNVATFSPVAQLVERFTVNEHVPGSSPGRGAFKKRLASNSGGGALL